MNIPSILDYLSFNIDEHSENCCHRFNCIMNGKPMKKETKTFFIWKIQENTKNG